MIRYFYIEECSLCDARTDLSIYLLNKPRVDAGDYIYASCNQCDYTQTLLYQDEDSIREITLEEARLLDIKERL